MNKILKENKIRSFNIKEMSGFLLYSTYFSWKRFIESTLLKFELTNTQLILLISLNYLKAVDKDLSQNDLANFLNFDANMTSQVIRVLEKNKLILRYQNPGNDRSKFLKMTQTGMQKIDEVFDELLHAENSFFSTLGQNKKNLDEFLSSLLQGSVSL